MLNSTYTNESSPGSWTYFTYSAVAGHGTLRVQIAQRVGAVEVFATKCQNRYECSASDYPSTTHHLTNVTKLYPSIEVARYDIDASLYMFGILSRQNLFASYLLTVTLEDNILALQSGVTVYEHVDKGYQTHFSFTPTLNLVVNIQLYAVYGDADLYVSTKFPRPTAANRSAEESPFPSLYLLFINLNLTFPSDSIRRQHLNCPLSIAAPGAV
jgi:hypothetical protein